MFQSSAPQDMKKIFLLSEIPNKSSIFSKMQKSKVHFDYEWYKL